MRVLKISECPQKSHRESKKYHISEVGWVMGLQGQNPVATAAL